MTTSARNRSPRARARSGFTLVETVVTVGLLAVLAAFVIPSVMRKADAADPVKVAHDLNAIATAVQTFAADVKGAMPGDLEDLLQPLQVNQSCGVLTPCDSTVTHRDTYKPQQAELWRGPYLTASLSALPSAELRSGYVAEISNVLQRYDAFNGVPEWCPTESGTSVRCAGFVVTNPLYVAVRVNGLTLAQAEQVNRILDGPHERRPGLEGRVRFDREVRAFFYLAAPVGP